MPLHRRIPHLKGFKNTRKQEFNIINVGTLNKFDNETVVDFDFLKKKGLIMKNSNPLKILGNGNLEKKLTVKANFFSKSAVKKIEQLGGKAEIVLIRKNNNKKNKKKK